MKELTLFERFTLALGGYKFIGYEQREGWSEPAPMFLFKCSLHGFVKSRPRGYEKHLICPSCEKMSIEEHLKR